MDVLSLLYVWGQLLYRRIDMTKVITVKYERIL